MNEGNYAARPQRRRHSFAWLWILLLLFAFTGGIVLGLNLNRMPMPNQVRDRLYPVLEALIPGSTAVRPQGDVPVQTSAPQETPVPITPTPMPTQAPTEFLIPVDTPAPETVKPSETDTPTGYDVVGTEGLTMEDTARFESPENTSARFISMDAALEVALKHAEIEKKDANVTGVYRTKDAVDQTVYEVSFSVGEISYDYVISALDGEILGWKMSGFHMEDTETFGAETPLPAAPDKA